MANIKAHALTGYWAMPFRPFFSMAAAYGCVALIIWVAVFRGLLALPVDLNWHIQEMVYGFAAAVVVGFLLTAAQTWTQVQTIKGKPLMLFAAVWLTARLCSISFPMVSMIADTLFLVAASLILGRMVLIAKSTRNGFFVPLLWGLAGMRVHQYLNPDIQLWWIAVLIVIQFVLIIGGRVIPFFTARGLQLPQAAAHPFIEHGSSIISVLFIGSWLWGDATLVRVMAAMVALVHLARWTRWQRLAIYKVPLLWSLHLSYLAIVLGFAALALGMPRSGALHLITVGGIAGMILAMMSRVTLGHTGRPLQVGNAVALSFVAIALAWVTRAVAAVAGSAYAALLWSSLVLWCIAFVIFLIHYLPILRAPRVDGRPG